MARSSLEVGQGTTIVPGLFSLRLIQNPGAAFGVLGAWPILLTLVGLAAVLMILGLRKERSRSRVVAVSLGLMLGGVIGNLIDRILFRSVTDFLDLAIIVHGREISWPTFNLADLAITAGVILLACHIFLTRDEKPGENTPPKARIDN